MTPATPDTRAAGKAVSGGPGVEGRIVGGDGGDAGAVRRLAAGDDDPSTEDDGRAGDVTTGRGQAGALRPGVRGGVVGMDVGLRDERVVMAVLAADGVDEAVEHRCAHVVARVRERGLGRPATSRRSSAST